jgi:hypothetical protein
MDYPIGSPSSCGVVPESILAFVDAIDNDKHIEPHGLIIQRHGRRIAEGYWAPHTADRQRLVYSLSKTFTGTALGLQIAEGRLALDDLVSDHLPEMFQRADGSAIDDRTKRMRVRHIASMSSGHNREMLLEAILFDRHDPVRGFLSIPPDHEPGTVFAYSQPPVLALATILQRLAGERLVEYLQPRVLDQLGIGDLRWSQHQPGIDLGFSGVHTSLDAIARLGQLYLDDGMWNGQRLLPSGWVAEASMVQTPNPEREEPDWRQGYGFQLWRSRHGYRGDGAFGQYMVVLPEHDAVIALFSCVENMQHVLDLMWEHLLPAMRPEPESADQSGVGNSTEADDAVARRLASLALPTAAQRLGGAPVHAPPHVLMWPADSTPTSQSTMTEIEMRADRVLITERSARSNSKNGGPEDGHVNVEISLSSDWTSTEDSAFAASATTLSDGRIAIDIVTLETPHRLEVVLDPVTQTFSTHWPVMPLALAGTQTLASMRAPQ